MASSRVMAAASSSPTAAAASSDLARQSSIYSLTISELDHATRNTLGSMSMDDLLRTIYPDGGGAAPEPEAYPPLAREGSFSLPRSIGSKTVDEVWKEITGAGGGGDATAAAAAAAYGEMTLEDFLARAGAMREEDVSAPSGSMQGGYGVGPMMVERFGQHEQQLLALENPMLGFGNGVDGGGGGGGRGRKRPVMDPVNKAALQRQKRMIKNRESAARSRERKQAYTVELESLVAQLEEENSRLLNEKEEQNRARHKKLMENIIPVTEKKKPRRALRRTQSIYW